MHTVTRPADNEVTDLEQRRRLALVREVYAQACARRGWSTDPWAS